MRYLPDQQCYILECSERLIKELRCAVLSPPRDGVPMEWELAAGQQPLSLEERVEIAAFMSNIWLSWAVCMPDWLKAARAPHVATPKPGLVRVQ